MMCNTECCTFNVHNKLTKYTIVLLLARNNLTKGGQMRGIQEVLGGLVQFYAILFEDIKGWLFLHQAGSVTTLAFLVGCGLMYWGLQDCFDLKSRHHHTMWQVAIIGLFIAVVALLSGVVIIAHSLNL